MFKIVNCRSVFNMYAFSNLNRILLKFVWCGLGVREDLRGWLLDLTHPTDLTVTSDQRDPRLLKVYNSPNVS